jgi:hypothetical protein
LEEGEADEKRGYGAECEFGDNVARHTPVLLEYTVGALPDLCRERHGIRATTRLTRNVDVLVRLLLMQLIDLLLDFLRIVTLLPDIEPLLVLVVSASVDNLKHVFGRVLLLAALAPAMGLEVLEKRLGVLADFAEVDCLSAFGKEEQAVEFLEEDGAGLMDGAEDGLAGGGQLLEEGDDGPGALLWC